MQRLLTRSARVALARRGAATRSYDALVIGEHPRLEISHRTDWRALFDGPLDGSRRRTGADVDIPWRRVAAPPRGATWIFRGRSTVAVERRRREKKTTRSRGAYDRRSTEAKRLKQEPSRVSIRRRRPGRHGNGAALRPHRAQRGRRRPARRAAGARPANTLLRGSAAAATRLANAARRSRDIVDAAATTRRRHAVRRDVVDAAATTRRRTL